MKPLTIDWINFLKGESTSDDAPDKGFSPNSYGLNLTKSLGMLYFTEASTDRGGATLAGNILASAYDKSVLGNDTYHLDDEGNVYTLDGSTFTLRQTATADTFVLGTSDLLQFRGDLYATSQTRVMVFGNSDLTTIDSSWWTGLQTSVRHPLERVEGTLYIGDANNIHTWDGTTSTSAAIALPSDVNITSLRKHPDGMHLIAFCGLTADFSHTKGSGGRIYIIDTVIKDWVREIDIDVQVEGSKNIGGVVYVTYGKNVGYFDGNGIQFLKKLQTSATTYSQCMSDMEGTLLVRDGQHVLAFGDLGAGKVWWKPYKNDVSNANINNVIYKGDNVLLVGFTDGAAAGYLREIDYDNGGLSGKFYANRTIMPGTCEMKRFEALHTPVSGTYLFYGAHKDETDTEQTFFVSNSAFESGAWGKYRYDISIKTDLYQLVVTPSNGAPGFRFFRTWYAGIE